MSTFGAFPFSNFPEVAEFCGTFSEEHREKIAAEKNHWPLAADES